MTTYLGEKPVGIGTIKATEAVGKVITDKTTILGDGFTDPLKVNTLLFATSESVAASAEAIRTEVNNKFTVVDSAIQGANEAIVKTREDYIQADSEIHQILNNHAGELTTLRGNQASLGDQVSNIESKIPQSASGSNPLVTKQQLLDEEMDIREDLNETSSELQPQITAQASEIAKIKQEVSGLSSLSFVVLDELPSTGEEGTIYLIPSGGEAPNLHDEYIWTNGAFEVIGSTQVDLTDYVKRTDYASANTAGVIKVSDAFGIIINEDGTLYAARANLDGYNAKSKHYVIGKDTLENIKNDLVKRAVTENNIVLTDEEKAAAQEWLGVSDGLPDQTGNSGKFLITDGSTASWGDLWFSKGLSYRSDSPAGFSLTPFSKVFPNLKSSIILGGSQYGQPTASKCATALGINASAGNYSVSVGYFASCAAVNAIQINASGEPTTNADANTFKVANENGNFEMMSADGTIPAERMTKVIVLTDSTVELATNTIYNAGEMATLSITFPTADETYVSQLNFTSGAMATAFTAPDTIKWIGDDVTDGAFVPATNKRYAIMFYYDGIQLRGAIQGVA